MGTIQLIEKRGEKKGIAIGEKRGATIGEKRGVSIGEKRGVAIGEKRGQAEKEAMVVVNGYSKGYDFSTIADITGLTIAKVKAILRKNGEI